MDRIHEHPLRSRNRFQPVRNEPPKTPTVTATKQEVAIKQEAVQFITPSEVKVEQVSKQELWQKKGLPSEKNAIIAHTSRISNNNLDFIATLDRENAGTWEWNIINYNTDGSYDKGICQFNSRYFMHIINDPEFSNPEWQVNKCWELYTEWEKRGILADRFYAYPNRGEAKKNFELITVNN